MVLGFLAYKSPLRNLRILSPFSMNDRRDTSPLFFAYLVQAFS